MLLNKLPFIMFRSLLFTIIIEVIIGFVLRYRGKDLVNIVLVNILTNPVVVSTSVYFNICYGIKGRTISLVFLELGAFLVEGLIYKKYLERDKLNPIVLSLILNLSSFLIGELINHLI